ncbi:hypothetical protein [Nocardioides marmorisolisilvae]|uniref:hypothetical protein n=1 Tax=Nocardioides marmorisolisilvae TaxID=1542737 RepID=UPI0011CD4BA8|nr:hypothetical protein [Nocardioides marmorisolisilvae]
MEPFADRLEADPEDWIFDVLSVELLRSDNLPRRSRVIVSRAEYPNWVIASETAALIVAAVHRSTPIRVDPVY